MQTAARLASYGATLVLVFGATWGVGSTLGGTGAAPGPVPDTPMSGMAMPAMSAHGGQDDDPDATDGYQLVQTATARKGELGLTIVGPDGRPAPMRTSADPEHSPYLAVIRHDGTGYQRLAPVVDGSGWRAPLTLNRPGLYRVLAQFTPPGGQPAMLGTDVFAPGEVTSLGLTPTRTFSDAGYQVRIDGDLVPGGPSQIFATISKDGRPVTDLQPYLGAFGQLTVLRAADLASMPVRSDAAPAAPNDRSGPGIAFIVDVPTPGTYRLFLEYDRAGVTRSAEFTIATRGTS